MCKVCNDTGFEPWPKGMTTEELYQYAWGRVIQNGELSCNACDIGRKIAGPPPTYPQYYEG